MFILTPRESVTDSKNSSGKVRRQIGEAAEVAARQAPVQEHAQAQQADGVVRVTTKVVGGESQHLKIVVAKSSITPTTTSKHCCCRSDWQPCT